MSNGIYELTSFDLNNHFFDNMILIEKYNPEKIYTVVHFEGKSKNYLIKRFAFENTPPGKETSIISDENGSKLTFISGAAAPMAKIDQLKGKTQTPETIEVNLTELIDVKGMKAMGNRVSQHTIQSITLIEPEEEEVIAPDTEESSEIIEPEIEDATEAVKEETKTPGPEAVEIPKETPTTVEPAQEEPAKEKSAESPPKSVESEIKPPKKIDFEITNPGDIEIDDKGQLGLF